MGQFELFDHIHNHISLQQLAQLKEQFLKPHYPRFPDNKHHKRSLLLDKLE